MLHVAGHDLPWLARGAVVLAVLAGAVWLGDRLRRSTDRRTALLLAGLVGLALAVRFTGLSHEVEGRYYLDEGTYYHHASEIDAGRWLRLSFVYPHFVYYADAVALWLAGLFPGVAGGIAGAVGVTDPLGVSWLGLRGVVAILSALTVVPVFRIAERLAGWRGGTAAALLLIFSPLFNAGSHLNTCDVPSGVFATLCLLFVARLIDEESAHNYVLAGIAAGLAAGSKYPAGVVAVAIVAVWVRWRLVRRDFRWGLLWAGLAAVAALVAVMPSLVVFPEAAFLGNRGIFYGTRQYGQGGWLGVMPRSNGLFYAGHLLDSFGIPAVLAGLSGLLLIRRGERHRWLWLLPFPVIFLALLTSMSMVVKRNLYPAVPILAALLGVGIAVWWEQIEKRLQRPAIRSALVAGLALACLALPLQETVAQDISLARPTTREEAAAWIRANVPAGASIMKESYTPDFPAGTFRVLHQRFVTRLSIDELRRFDYVLVANAAYGRFADPAALTKPHQRAMAERYAEIFRTFELVREWRPAGLQEGPVLRLYRPSRSQ
jgi:4-amino-4-deoxy-L-arabinose transferase-like glycosyltransferase